MTTVAVAGRRVDGPEASPPRFPLAATGAVEKRLFEYFAEHGTHRLVASAACGADLLALKAAEEAKITSRTIVLPFGVEDFRRTSVTDRPGAWLDRHGRGGDWSALYDQMIADAEAMGTLVVLGCEPGNEHAYAAATERIVAEAARDEPAVRGCIVWEGTTRRAVDHSNALATSAGRHGWPVDQISTLS